jgi:hypothetical protein
MCPNGRINAKLCGQMCPNGRINAKLCGQMCPNGHCTDSNEARHLSEGPPSSTVPEPLPRS